MPARPSTAAERIDLRDGRLVLVRPLSSSDKDALAAGFELLSPESRYRRFLTPTPKLSSRQLEYLMEVDHDDHEALVAIDPGTGLVIAVARYVKLVDEKGTAEASVAVVDEWQRVGLGRELTQRLAALARADGVERFSARLLSDNGPAWRLLEELGPVETRDAYGGAVEIRALLEPRR